MEIIQKCVKIKVKNHYMYVQIMQCTNVNKDFKCSFLAWIWVFLNAHETFPNWTVGPRSLALEGNTQLSRFGVILIKGFKVSASRSYQ